METDTPQLTAEEQAFIDQLVKEHNENENGGDDNSSAAVIDFQGLVGPVDDTDALSREFHELLGDAVSVMAEAKQLSLPKTDAGSGLGAAHHISGTSTPMIPEEPHLEDLQVEYAKPKPAPENTEPQLNVEVKVASKPASVAGSGASSPKSTTSSSSMYSKVVNPDALGAQERDPFALYERSRSRLGSVSKDDRKSSKKRTRRKSLAARLTRDNKKAAKKKIITPSSAAASARRRLSRRRRASSTVDNIGRPGFPSRPLPRKPAMIDKDKYHKFFSKLKSRDRLDHPEAQSPMPDITPGGSRPRSRSRSPQPASSIARKLQRDFSLPVRSSTEPPPKGKHGDDQTPLWDQPDDDGDIIVKQSMIEHPGVMKQKLRELTDANEEVQQQLEVERKLSQSLQRQLKAMQGAEPEQLAEMESSFKTKIFSLQQLQERLEEQLAKKDNEIAFLLAQQNLQAHQKMELDKQISQRDLVIDELCRRIQELESDKPKRRPVGTEETADMTFEERMEVRTQQLLER